MAMRPVQPDPPREIDALLADELLAAGDRRPSPLCDPDGLHVCQRCALPFVVPGEVREVVGADRVRLDLACTNCGWQTTSVHHDAELSRLELQLDRSFADLLWTLEVVWIANEEGAIERFAAALDAGAILAEDF